MSADSHLGGAPAVESVEVAVVYTVPIDAPESAARGAQGRCTLHRAFRHDQRPLGEAEGAFLLCGFMMALAEHQQGHTAHALRLFERNRAACGPPGLFSEEYDIIQRQMRGNLPQAFVHALLPMK